MGIIFHVGLTPQRGHYTSMVRSDKHNSQHAWFLTNDATVSMLTEKDVSNIVSSTLPDDEITPYILLYRLISLT